MKIAFVFFDGPQRFKGPGVNVSRLLPALVQRGHEVHGLCMHHDHDPVLAGYLAGSGVKCRIAPFTDFDVTKETKWLLHAIKEIDTDIFVANLCVAGFYAARWIRESGIATVACHRGDHAFHWSMAERFVHGAQAWAVSGLVCVSRDIMARVVSREPEWTQARFIPSGVPVPDITEKPRDNLRIVYAGGLVQKPKRVLDMIDTIDKFLDRDPEATFTMIGDGPERDECQRRISLGKNADRIFLAGAVEPWDIQASLRPFNVAVLLSDYEGTPGFLMDAMACGLTPVCLDIPGGVRELIVDGVTGLLARNRDADFLDKLELIAKNIDLRERIAQAACRKIVESYSLDAAAVSWESFCADLMTSQRTVRVPVQIPQRLRLPPREPAFGIEDRRRPSPAIAWCVVPVVRMKKRLAGACWRRAWDRESCKALRALNLAIAFCLQPYAFWRKHSS